MKRYISTYVVWVAAVVAFAFALAAFYRHTQEISWGEVARRVRTGDTTDATDTTVSDDGSR